MIKQPDKMADGRNIIYYSFEDEAEEPADGEQPLTSQEQNA